jgi:hypothetical protein
MLNRKRDKAIAAGLSPAAQPELDPAELKKEGGKLGSNEGGTFTDKAGNKFYIKRPETKAHVENELAASRLYKLAGVGTLDYRPVKGGNHVATEWEQLDKNNISKMTAAERKEATKDFAVHAWLSNWDAAGTGGDNQGVRGGKPVTLDVGGSLRYRAQGTPKGAAFGNKVTEVDTMRDPGKSHDAGEAVRQDERIGPQGLVGRASDVDPGRSDPQRSAPNAALADTLIARKQDLAKRFGTQAADEAHFEESKHPRDPDGKFAQKLVDQFNKTYEGKVLTSPADLTKKVDAFKDLQAAMIPLMSGEQKKQAEAAQKAKAQAEITAKAQAAQYAKDVAEAAKKNKDVIEALGISPQQAEGVVELAKMLGSKTGDLVEKFKSYAKAAENYGYPITGFQAALISNYSDGGYHEINKALRSGAWTPAQHAYVAMVNKALMAMPKHTGGGLTRHTSLTADQQKGYLQGHIVQEHALMSTSTGSVFSGNTTFKVTGIGKRGASIQKLSNHAGEKEVLFAAKTYFKVNKVEGTPGGKMVIHLEEWEEHV